MTTAAKDPLRELDEDRRRWLGRPTEVATEPANAQLVAAIADVRRTWPEAAAPASTHPLGVVVAAAERLAVAEGLLEDARELAKLRGDLLACYRTGKQPSGRLLDRLQELRGRVEGPTP